MVTHAVEKMLLIGSISDIWIPVNALFPSMFLLFVLEQIFDPWEVLGVFWKQLF